MVRATGLARFAGLLGMVSLLVISLVGCAESGRAVAEPVPSATVDPSLASTAPSDSSSAPLGVPGKFAGDGSRVLSLWIEAGTWIFRVTHEGSSGFAVLISSPEGKRLDDLGQGTASSKLTYLNIKRSGLYRLDITADGHWTIGAEGCTCSAESE